jgi:hypothetical protein
VADWPRRPGTGQVQRDIDDDVFLPADEAAAADLEQQFAYVHLIAIRGCLGVAKERSVHARINPG